MCHWSVSLSCLIALTAYLLPAPAVAAEDGGGKKYLLLYAGFSGGAEWRSPAPDPEIRRLEEIVYSKVLANMKAEQGAGVSSYSAIAEASGIAGLKAVDWRTHDGAGKDEIKTNMGNLNRILIGFFSLEDVMVFRTIEKDGRNRVDGIFTVAFYVYNVGAKRIEYYSPFTLFFPTNTYKPFHEYFINIVENDPDGLRLQATAPGKWAQNIVGSKRFQQFTAKDSTDWITVRVVSKPDDIVVNRTGCSWRQTTPNLARLGDYAETMALASLAADARTYPSYALNRYEGKPTDWRAEHVRGLIGEQLSTLQDIVGAEAAQLPDADQIFEARSTQKLVRMSIELGCTMKSEDKFTRSDELSATVKGALLSVKDAYGCPDGHKNGACPGAHRKADDYDGAICSTSGKPYFELDHQYPDTPYEKWETVNLGEREWYSAIFRTYRARLIRDKLKLIADDGASSAVYNLEKSNITFNRSTGECKSGGG
jgi:hypothetical protein